MLHYKEVKRRGGMLVVMVVVVVVVAIVVIGTATSATTARTMTAATPADDGTSPAEYQSVESGGECAGGVSGRGKAAGRLRWE